MQYLAMIAVLATITILLMRRKSRMLRREIESLLLDEGSDIVFVRSCFPPIRHWLSGTDDDSWCVVRLPDGKKKYARLRLPRYNPRFQVME